MLIKSMGLFGALSAAILATPASGVLGDRGDPASRLWPRADAVSYRAGDDSAELEPGVLVVALKQSGQLALVDAETGEVRTLVDLRGRDAEDGAGVGPHEVAVSGDRRTAVVSLYGGAEPGNELVFVSLPDGSISGRMVLEGYTRPHGLVFVGEGAEERLLVTAETQQSLLQIDPLAREVEFAVETMQWGSHMVAACPTDPGRVFVSNVGSASVSVVDIEKRELDRIVATAPGAEGIAVRPGEGEGAGEVWVANNQAHNISVLDAESLEVKRSLVCASIPIRVVFTPDGGRALVTSVGTGELVVFDAETYAEVGRVDVLSGDHYSGVHPQLGTSPVPVGLVVSPAGRFAYVSSIAGGYVSVVDLEALEVVRVFDLGDGMGPDGIAFVSR